MAGWAGFNLNGVNMLGLKIAATGLMFAFICGALIRGDSKKLPTLLMAIVLVGFFGGLGTIVTGLLTAIWF